MKCSNGSKWLSKGLTVPGFGGLHGGINELETQALFQWGGLHRASTALLCNELPIARKPILSTTLVTIRDIAMAASWHRRFKAGYCSSIAINRRQSFAAPCPKQTVQTGKQRDDRRDEPGGSLAYRRGRNPVGCRTRNRVPANVCPNRSLGTRRGLATCKWADAAHTGGKPAVAPAAV